MKGRFILDYLDENNFKKLERSLKKYNMVAYKKLMFDYYPKKWRVCWRSCINRQT